MTLLAHWPIDDGRERPSTPQTIRDIAGGGSGAHDGQVSSWGGAYLNPGGLGGCHLGRISATGGWVQNIANASDLQLLGEMTVMGWASPNQQAGWDNTIILASCSGDNNSEAQNSAWVFDVNARKLRMYWYTGSGSTQVMVSTTNPVTSRQGFQQFAAVRYEITPGSPSTYGVRFYVDGALVEDVNNGGTGFTGPTGAGSSIPYVGRRKDFVVTYPSESCLDSFRVYDTAELTAAVLAVFNAEEPIIVGAYNEDHGNIEDFSDTDDGSVYKGIVITGDSHENETAVGDNYDGVESGNNWYQDSTSSEGPYEIIDTGPLSRREDSGWVIN